MNAYERGYTHGFFEGDVAPQHFLTKYQDIRQYHLGFEQGEIDKSLGLEPDYRRNYRPAKPAFDLSNFDYRLAEAYAIGYHHGKTLGHERNPFPDDKLPEMSFVYGRGFEAGVRASKGA